MAKKQAGESTKAPAPSAEQKALNNAISQIEKAFGSGAIMRLGEGSSLEVEGVSTGALSLDLALGGSGLPKGRIIELFGPESSGKTTIALHAVANAQKMGGVAAFIDAEHALDPSWCKRLGVDIESLLVSQPSSAEDALQIAEMLVHSDAVDIIVVDSVAALVPKAEIEGEIGDSHVGLQARLMSQALRKLTGRVSKSKCVLIFINQIREKIGVMFGSPETTPGGRALKFYSSCRIDVRRIGPVKEGEDVVGSRVKVKVVKNKVAPPFRVCEFDIMYNHGISQEGDLIDLALADKLIEKSGSWFNYGDIRLGQGRENVKTFLKENPATAEEIRLRILEKRVGGEPLAHVGDDVEELDEE
ncbi:MAG: recombinase RecA [Isosphaeraceae bacterium]|nr:recombinase RecA [Isosphaeraceae bacterium]